MSTAQRQTLLWPTRCLLQSLDDEIAGFPRVSALGGSRPPSFPVALFVRPMLLHLSRELLVSPKL